MEKQNLKNPNETHYVLVVDKSGSMSHLTESTITGVNEQVQTIKNLQDKYPTQSYFMTYVNFNEDVDVEFTMKKASDLEEINRSNYVANGGTALNDAIGKGIALMQSNTDLMEKIKTGEGSIVFVIITDGEENSSKEYKIDAIRENIKLLEKTDRWSFVFIGANIEKLKAPGDNGFPRFFELHKSHAKRIIEIIQTFPTLLEFQTSLGFSLEELVQWLDKEEHVVPALRQLFLMKKSLQQPNLLT